MLKEKRSAYVSDMNMGHVFSIGSARHPLPVLQCMVLKRTFSPILDTNTKTTQRNRIQQRQSVEYSELILRRAG